MGILTQNKIFKKVVETRQDDIQINLQSWTEPFEKLIFDADMPSFCTSFVTNFVENDLDKIDDADKLPKSYQYLSMTTSFLDFLGINADHLKEHLAKEYPTLLVLMNINGGVCLRTKDRIPMPQEGCKIDVFKYQGKFHYLRSGYMPFLERIMKHPRVRFAFNSGISRKNIVPIMTKMFNIDDKMSLIEDHMFAIFDQSFNDRADRKDAVLKDDKYGFVRNLQKIWDSETCKQYAEETDGVIFGPTNTLMVETDEKDVQNYTQNSLIVEAITAEQIVDSESEVLKLI